MAAQKKYTDGTKKQLISIDAINKIKAEVRIKELGTTLPVYINYLIEKDYDSKHDDVVVNNFMLEEDE